MKFHDYLWNTLGATDDISEKLSILSISRAITVAFLIKWKRKYPGAQQLMVTNIPMKFHDYK